jgi:hypothetical protein
MLMLVFSSTVGDIVDNCRVEHMVEMPQLITLFCLVINVFIYRNYYYKFCIGDNSFMC